MKSRALEKVVSRALLMALKVEDEPDEPEQPFGCGVLLGLELINDERLERFGLGGSS